MIIEVLYSDLYLHGDDANVKYLEDNLANAKFIYTGINEEPYFSNNKVDAVIMGSLTEDNLLLARDNLSKYKDKIKEMIENDVLFLVFGNCLSLFGKSVNEENMLNVFDFNIKRDFDNRKNYLKMGIYNDIKILGFISSFDTLYNNDNSFVEGIKYKNFYGTYLLGPFLILNPYFTKEIIKVLDTSFKELKYEKEIIDAYNQRLKEYEVLLK